MFQQQWSNKKHILSKLRCCKYKTDKCFERKYKNILSKLRCCKYKTDKCFERKYKTCFNNIDPTTNTYSENLDVVNIKPTNVLNHWRCRSTSNGWSPKGHARDRLQRYAQLYAHGKHCKSRPGWVGLIGAAWYQNDNYATQATND